jgi:hypothetical protein
MADQDISPASTEPNADRISELERRNAELERRYAASSEEGKRLAQLNQQLQQSAFEPRQAVPQRGSPYDRLNEAGVDAGAVDEIVERRVSERIQQAFAPIAKGFQARQEMMAEHPDFAEHESQVAAFVQQDDRRKARYESMFQADPTGANEWAYLAYGAANQKNGKQAADTTRRTMREEAAHAAIPTERSGETRRRPDDESEVREAAKAVRDSGKSRESIERYAKLRLKQAIPDGFLSQ